MYRSKSVIGLDLFFRMFYRDERPAARRIVKTSDTVDSYLTFFRGKKDHFLADFL